MSESKPPSRTTAEKIAAAIEISKSEARTVRASKLPPPIEALHGNTTLPDRYPAPAKWQKWQHIPKCELWKAICLTFDIEPDEEKHGIKSWLQSRRGVPYGFHADFADRLQVAQANMSTNGPIRPQSLNAGVLQNPRADVLLSEVAAAAIRWQWAIPEPLQALVRTQPAVSTPEGQPVPSTGTSNSKPWLEIDPRDPTPEQSWYTPARYFARQLVLEDTTLLTKRLMLADKVVQSLYGVGVYKRGGVKQRFTADTVLKSFSNVTLN